MSGYAGELFVRIVPDAQGFDKSLQSQIGKQTSSGNTFSRLQADQRATQNELAKTAKAAQLASAQFLLGAGSEEAQAKAAEAYTVAARAAAQANLALAVSTGEGVEAALAQAAALQVSDRALDEHTRHAQRFRQQARLVAEGEAPLSSLFGATSLLRFGAGALAFGAIVTTLGQVEKSLKVTGEEAFTTEGRLRNLTSAILTGNVIEAFHALNDQTATVSERLQILKDNANTTAPELEQLGFEASRQADKLNEVVAAQAKFGDNSSGFQKVREQTRDIAEETARAATEAEALARAYRTSEQAVLGVDAAIKQAGSDAARFGEQARGAGGVAAGTPFAGRQFSDNTDTTSTSDQVAESLASRTVTLKDDLAVAKKEAAEQALLEKNQREVVEGAAARHAATVAAETKVFTIQNQIDAKEAAAAKQAAAEAKRRRDEAQRAYEQQVANNVERLKTAADAAGNTGKSEKALLSILATERRDQKLSEAERLKYSQDLVNERQNQRKASLAAAHKELAENIKYAIDVAQLDVRRAELTKNTIVDDQKADRALIALYKSAAQTKGLTKEERRAYVLAAKNTEIDLQGLKASKSTDLFQEAASEFTTFGSNISRGGPLSGQDARASFGKTVLDSILSMQLTEAQKQTSLLQQLLAASMSASWTRKTVGLPTNPNAGGYQFSSGFAARAAAANGFGTG